MSYFVYWEICDQDMNGIEQFLNENAGNFDSQVVIQGVRMAITEARVVTKFRIKPS